VAVRPLLGPFEQGLFLFVAHAQPRDEGDAPGERPGHPQVDPAEEEGTGLERFAEQTAVAGSGALGRREAGARVDGEARSGLVLRVLRCGRGGRGAGAARVRLRGAAGGPIPRRLPLPDSRHDRRRQLRDLVIERGDHASFPVHEQRAEVPAPEAEVARGRAALVPQVRRAHPPVRQELPERHRFVWSEQQAEDRYAERARLGRQGVALQAEARATRAAAVPQDQRRQRRLSKELGRARRLLLAQPRKPEVRRRRPGLQPPRRRDHEAEQQQRPERGRRRSRRTHRARQERQGGKERWERRRRVGSTERMERRRRRGSAERAERMRRAGSAERMERMERTERRPARVATVKTVRHG